MNEQKEIIASQTIIELVAETTKAFGPLIESFGFHPNELMEKKSKAIYCLLTYYLIAPDPETVAHFRLAVYDVVAKYGDEARRVLSTTIPPNPYQGSGRDIDNARLNWIISCTTSNSSVQENALLAIFSEDGIANDWHEPWPTDVQEMFGFLYNYLDTTFRSKKYQK